MTTESEMCKKIADVCKGEDLGVIFPSLLVVFATYLTQNAPLGLPVLSILGQNACFLLSLAREFKIDMADIVGEAEKYQNNIDIHHEKNIR